MSEPVADPTARPPQFAQAFHTAVNAIRQSHIPTAIHHFQECLRILPADYDATCGLADCLRMIGQLTPAKELTSSAMEMDPSRKEAYMIRALCFDAEYLFSRALKDFLKAQELEPTNPLMSYYVTQTYFRLNLYQEAEEAADHCLEVSADSFLAAYYKAQCREIADDKAGADEWYKNAIDISERLGRGSLFQLAKVMETEGHLEWAEYAADRLAKHDDSLFSSLTIKASIHQQLGQFNEAEIDLKGAIQLHPQLPRPYYDLVFGRKVTESDRPMLEKMQQILSTRGIDLEGRRVLNYALGKAFSDLKDYKMAMRYYDEANAVARIQLGTNVISKQAQSDYVGVTMNTFTREMLERRKVLGNPSDLPILIVGMIRSGTTLCEQILSSHPEIGAAGEVPYLTFRSFGKEENYEDLDLEEAMKEYSEDYLKILKSKAPGKKHVTDKNPLNFRILGSTHIAFPKAKIIHMRRNPAETCLSIYLTPFVPNLNYGHDQDTIGYFYIQYLRLMNHWRRVLPKDVFLEVNYEDLVLNKEAETRRMIEFLGLEWDDSLLHHDQNSRIIQTPSQWQARQPIYKTSLDRFSLFEPYLDGLKKMKELKLPN